MNDHYHYDYAEQRHDHREYAEQRHDHDGEFAERYHRHHDDESTIAGLRQDLGAAESRISELERELSEAHKAAIRLAEKCEVEIRSLWGALHAMPGYKP